MKINNRNLGKIYKQAHDRMRSSEGLLPQEALDELLKYLFFRDYNDNYTNNSLQTKQKLNVSRDIRQTFSKALKTHAPWAKKIWPTSDFHISDKSLEELHKHFVDIPLQDIPLDLRSTALWTFLNPERRKSMGIYTTPEEVVRMMIEVISPNSSEVILDPACGTGTFLMETYRYLIKQKRTTGSQTFFGVDMNPRMLLIACLNLGMTRYLSFKNECADALRDILDDNKNILGLKENSVDTILTNPPFGVTLSMDTYKMASFKINSNKTSGQIKRVPSEILFIELCLRLMKPGGKLGIVLPRSVITNGSLDDQRKNIDQLGYITDIVDLPSETFSSTGTQTTTVAAFFRKHHNNKLKTRTQVQVCSITNVGFDATGRYRSGNQLPLVNAALRNSIKQEGVSLTQHKDIPCFETLQRSSQFILEKHGRVNGYKLGKYLKYATTGLTPARRSYTEDGVFILKVGNLTGKGIDWNPRDRNFISLEEFSKRLTKPKLLLKEGDILLTSSAHATKYIAKKVDILINIPYNIQYISFVGELICLRAKPGIDPFILLASLRHPDIRKDVQARVRGQTAHLHPADLLQVIIPWNLKNPSQDIIEIATMLKEEAELAIKINNISLKSNKLLDLLSTSSI